MTFNEYLYTDSQEIEVIFNYYLGYLSELSNANFSAEKQLQLKGVSDKFLNSIEKFSYFETSKREDYQELLNKLFEELNDYKQLDRKPFILKIIPFVNSKKKQMFKVQDAFYELYSATMSLVNDSIQKEYLYDSLELGDFYIPSKSNKSEITELINEAMELINEDSSITDMSKKALVNHLEKAIRDLNFERTNWTRFFGKLKEVSVLLAALASLAGNANTLYDAITKLEKAAIVVRKTSINISYNILNEVFHVQNMQNIGLLKNTILKVEDKTLPIDLLGEGITE
jgi:hypothetical protein